MTSHFRGGQAGEDVHRHLGAAGGRGQLDGRKSPVQFVLDQGRSFEAASDRNSAPDQGSAAGEVRRPRRSEDVLTRIPVPSQHAIGMRSRVEIEQVSVTGQTREGQKDDGPDG